MSILRKFRAIFRKEKLDAEMAEEMRAHLELQAAEHIARGMPPDEARYAAQRAFGGVEQIKERARDQRSSGVIWLEQLGQDVRYAGRQLRRSPGFACTAIATLALGIGATTAIFSAVNGIVLKPLPYEQPGQLVHVFETPSPGQQNTVSPGAFLDWREQSTLFEGLAAYGTIDLNFGGSGEPERLQGLRMSANGLNLLRARPILGRVFSADEDQPGKDKVVVLTHALWQRRFGGDPDVVNREVLLNNEPHAVIGVLPEGFLPSEAQEFVVPYVFPPTWRNLRGSHFLLVMGRLKPGGTVEQAHAELQTIRQATASLYPAWKREWSTLVVPMQEQLAQNLKSPLLILLAAVALVLLIGCTNIANLLLAKASARQKELTVRAALGASRGRIVRQLLTESVLLSIVGGALGILLAVWGVDALRNVIAAMDLPRAHEVTLDLNVLGVALAVAVATGLGFGLLPALQASRPQLTHALNDAARGSATTGGRLRSGLIVGEVALALMLLVGAGLVLRSFYRVVSEPTGFDPRNAVAMQLSLPLQKYRNNAQRALFHEQLTERIAALPGVEAAGVSSALSIRGGNPDRFFRISGRTDHREPGYDAEYVFCTTGYFRAMGIRLLHGRSFDLRDLPGARVAVISETMAREYFPGEDPIGRHIGYDKEKWEIIGIVGDMRTRGLNNPFRPIVYRLQSALDSPRDAHLVVRTGIAPAAAVASVRQVLRELDPTLPVANIQTLEELVGASVAMGRLTLVLLALFAGAALLLAAIGLYGVIAYTVTQRTREFGIRLALGATQHHVQGLMLRQGMTLVVIGLAVGVVGALSLARFLTTLLYEVKPTDPASFVGVSFVLLIVALSAIWLPARRAARVDPMIALRCE